MLRGKVSKVILIIISISLLVGMGDIGILANSEDHEDFIHEVSSFAVDVNIPMILEEEDEDISIVVLDMETSEHKALVKIREFAKTQNFRILEAMLVLIIGFSIIISIILEMIKRHRKPK